MRTQVLQLLGPVVAGLLAKQLYVVAVLRCKHQG